MRTQPRVGRTDAAKLWACDSSGWVRSSLLAGLALLVQVLQAPLLKDLNTLVDSQSPGAAVSGKGLPPNGGYATSPQGYLQAVFESHERTSDENPFYGNHYKAKTSAFTA